MTPRSTSSTSGNNSAAERVRQRYFISDEELGSGKFGAVRRGTCTETGHRVAVKIVDKTRLSSKQHRTLHREVSIMQQIDHADIISLIEHFEDEEQLFIVMELCDGVDLFEQITARGRFTETQARAAMRSVLRAVAHLHSIGISHRDIKPENFMTNAHSEDLKLIDFGLSAVMNQTASGGTNGNLGLRRMRSRVGTPYYIAPEILLGEEYDQSIDVWSCGVVFFIMVAGYAPFNGHTDREIFHEIKRGQVDFTSSAFDDVSAEAKQLIKSMLRRNSERRLTAEQALQHPFFHSAQTAADNGKRTLQTALRSALDTDKTDSCFADPAACPEDSGGVNGANEICDVNDEVFYLDFSVASCAKESLSQYPHSLKDKVRTMGKLLWRASQFGQLVSKRAFHSKIPTTGYYEP